MHKLNKKDFIFYVESEKWQQFFFRSYDADSKI